MGRLSDTYANKTLDAILGGAHSADMPATVYVALTVAGVEVSGGSYARVAVTNNDTNWPDASGRQKANGTAITFPQPTGTWGTVDGWELRDASTAGNIIIDGDLAAARNVTAASDPPEFAVGALVIPAPAV